MNLLTTGNSKFCPQPKPEKQPKPKYPGIRKVSLKKAQEIKNNPQASSRQAKSKSKPRELAAGEINFSTIKKKPYKATGEKIVFEMIWNERPHVCQVTGDPIPKFDHWCFMHILAKGTFKRFKLRKDNILLVTRFVHNEYDYGDRSHEMFDGVREQAEKLKLEYYQK